MSVLFIFNPRTKTTTILCFILGIFYLIMGIIIHILVSDDYKPPFSGLTALEYVGFGLYALAGIHIIQAVRIFSFYYKNGYYPGDKEIVKTHIFPYMVTGVQYPKFMGEDRRNLHILNEKLKSFKNKKDEKLIRALKKLGLLKTRPLSLEGDSVQMSGIVTCPDCGVYVLIFSETHLFCPLCEKYI